MRQSTLTALVISVPLTFVSCVPEDPRQQQTNPSEREPSSVQARRTAAPPEIDDAILSSRSFREAPMLTARVQAGALPAVAERLPDRPLVITPVEEIGVYGGTLRRALTGDIVQTPGPSKTLNENLMGYERPLPKSIEY